MELLTPDTIINGRYRVIRKIGQGGMGAVYEAADERLRNRVALKQTLVEGETFSQAFEREAQLLAGLRHPALPRVIDHFVDAQGQFLVMDYIEGEDLASLLKTRGGPFALAEVLRWANLLLDALEYLHTHDPPVIHRDIKPQNLKLTPRGELILLDFGLAKGSSTIGQPTRASLFGYTPQFAPLEQVQGTGTDARSDMYALGATLYNLLTGRSPVDVLSRAAALLNRQPDPLRPAHEVNPEVSPMLSGAISQAMAMAADERFTSAAAMRRALNAAAGALPSTGPTLVARAAPATVNAPATGRIEQPVSRPPSQPASRPPAKTDGTGFGPANFDEYSAWGDVRAQQRERRRTSGRGFAVGCLVAFLATILVIGGVTVAILRGVQGVVESADPAMIQTTISTLPTIGPTIDAAFNPPREQTREAAKEPAAPTAAASPVTASNATANAGSGGSALAEGSGLPLSIATVPGYLLFSNLTLEAPANTLVTLTFTNDTALGVPFNWVLVEGGAEVAEAVVAAAQDNFAGQFTPPAGTPGALAWTRMAQPGEQVSVTFMTPGPGTYLYICTYPGFFTAGVKGEFIVR